MDRATLAILAASRESRYPSVKQLQLLLLLLLSRHASAAQRQILVSRPIQSHRKRLPAASLHQSQRLQARSSTTRDERSRSCGYWMRHMHGAWQQRKQQPQPQPQESKGQLTLDSR